jgi:hypothetical protein
MPRLTQRLDRLEKTFRTSGGGTCRLCYGMPMATVQAIHEEHPIGGGFRPTGERYLQDDRVTDDLRCKGCGTAVRVYMLMSLVGIDRPAGRRLPALSDSM